MDSTGWDSSGLLQATEGLSMSYREDMWVMSEYYIQIIKYPDSKKVVIFNNHAIWRV